MKKHANPSMSRQIHALESRRLGVDAEQERRAALVIAEIALRTAPDPAYALRQVLDILGISATEHVIDDDAVPLQGSDQPA